MKIEELRIICDTVIKLTELRQKECKHLSIENFAAECFGKLLGEYSAHREGLIRYIPPDNRRDI